MPWGLDQAGWAFRDVFLVLGRGWAPGGAWHHGILFLEARVTGRPSCPGRIPTSALTPTATRSLGLSDVGLQRIQEAFISHFPERALRCVCVCEGAGTHLCLPVNVMLSVHPPRQALGGARQASRPGTRGVRPLTGSVAAADGRRRQGAETSVAHAAACPPRKGLHTSQRQQQRPCLEPIRMQAAGRQTG